MENARKHLRDMSIVVLVFALITCAMHIVDFLMMDFSEANLPEGSTAAILFISKIVMVVFAVIFLIPELYIGVKGIKIAKNPDCSKAHIVWAIILAVVAGFNVLSGISGLADDVISGLLTVLGAAVDVLIYILYIACAKKVRKAA